MNSERPIVLLGPAFPLRGGIANFNESFARSLQAIGQKVELVSFSYQYPSILFPGKSQKAKGSAPADLSIKEWISSVNFLSWKGVAKRIAAMKPSFVVIRYWLPFMAPALGSIAKYLRKKGIKVIGLVDNAIPHEKRPFDKTLSTYFFKHCDAFFTLSESVAKDLKSFEPEKPTATSPHPLYDMFGPEVAMSQARLNLNLESDTKYVLFFGFIRKYKGLDLLLEAFALEAVRKLNLKLVVAGEFYDDEKEYLEFIRVNQLESSVILRSDFIPQEEVKNYFCASNLVAQTYRSATQSGVTQIAYHFNKPMLVTDVGGLSEIVPNGKVGFVVKPEAKAIGDALIRYFEDELEASFSEAVKEHKEVFSWSHFTERFMTFANAEIE